MLKRLTDTPKRAHEAERRQNLPLVLRKVYGPTDASVRVRRHHALVSAINTPVTSLCLFCAYTGRTEVWVEGGKQPNKFRSDSALAA